MTKLNVKVKLTVHSEWVNYIVVARYKDKNRIRLCLESFNLNNVIQRKDNISLPTFEQITETLSKSKVLTVLDEE